MYFTSVANDMPPFESELRRLDLATRVLETLDGPYPFIEDVEQDAEYLYYATDVGILRVPKTGGDVQVVADIRSQLVDLVVDDTHVYWTDEEAGTVLRVAKPEP